MKTLTLILTAGMMAFAGSQSMPSSHRPRPEAFPFDADRSRLYSREELWRGYDSDPKKNRSLDWKIYEYYTGKAKYDPPRRELLAQRRHDSGMDLAITRFFASNSTEVPQNRKVVVLMGSHSTLRSDAWYSKIAHLAYSLARNGYFVVTGGGPGLMEAAHLGAYMAKRTSEELDDAIAILATSSEPADPRVKQYEMPDYWLKAQEVLKKYPKGEDSLGIPTWFYGHEGANAFSTFVAKYFSNALREEKLCAIGYSGVIFAPGGPGTMQEAFMDAAENSYGSYGWYSPMILFNDSQAALEMGRLIEETSSPAYRELKMVARTTSVPAVLEHLSQHPPVHVSRPKGKR